MHRVATIATSLPITSNVVAAESSAQSSILDDLRLFGLTYAAGFIVISLFLA